MILHGIACTEIAESWSVRPVLRALGGGMFAAASATGGYGLAAKHADQPGEPLQHLGALTSRREGACCARA